MDFRKLILIALLVTGSAPVMTAELWTEIYNERLAEAQQGSAEAQFEIGAMYENGRGVNADREQALQWYQKSADQGYARATSAIARMQDNQRRLDLTQSQAAAGDVDAQYKLGTMYLTGTGTGVDLKLAEQWLMRAAEKDHIKAQFKLGHLYYVELAEDGKLNAAFDWFSKAAVREYPPAYYYLGDMYATGSGIAKDYAKARDWYEKAQAAGFTPAVQALSELDTKTKQESARRAAAEAAQIVAAEAARAEASDNKTAQVVKAVTPVVAPPRDILERLIQFSWKDGKRPVQFLPSSLSECTPSDANLTCYSRELARRDLPQVHYKVKSIIRSPNNDSIKIVYRELVLQEIIVDTHGEDEALLRDTGIPPGWQEPHTLTCRFAADQKLSCSQEDGVKITFIGA